MKNPPKSYPLSLNSIPLPNKRERERERRERERERKKRKKRKRERERRKLIPGQTFHIVETERGMKRV